MKREWFWLDLRDGQAEYVHSSSGASIMRPEQAREDEWAKARAAFMAFYPNASRVRRRGSIGSSVPVDFLPGGPASMFPSGSIVLFHFPEGGSLKRIVDGQQLPLPACGEVPSYLLEGGEALAWSSSEEGWSLNGRGVYLKNVLPPRRLARAAA
jgi:hypothetical protein